MSRFWVPGGSGNWNATDTNNWSASSGGASGASVPTAADDVFFDGNSGAGTATIATTNALCKNIDFTGFTGTLAGIQGLNPSGSVVMGAGMTNNFTGNITLTVAVGTNTITSNGIMFKSNFLFLGGATIQLVDTFTVAGGITLQTGTTFDPNGQTVILRTINQSSFIFGNFTFFNLSLIADAQFTSTYQIQSFTVTNNLVITGGSASLRCRVYSGVLGTPATITAANVAVQSACFQDVIGAGAGSWNLSAAVGGSGDGGGNSGITFTPAATQYWFGGTAQWYDVTKWFLGTGGSGGAGRVPLPQDDVIFDANSFASAGQTVSVNGLFLGKNIDFTGVTNNPTLNLLSQSSQGSICGSLTFDPNMTLSTVVPTAGFRFQGRSAFTITMAGLTFPVTTQIEAFGGSYTLQDDFHSARAFTLANGTFDANNFDVTCLTFSSGGTFTRTLTMGSGTWTITGTGTAWNTGTPTGFTFNNDTSTIKFTDSSATTKTFSHSSSNGPINILWFSGTGVGIFSPFSGGTFGEFRVDAGLHVRFTSGQTYNVTTWTVSGTAGNLITIDALTPGSAATISKSSGKVCSDYLDLKDIHAGGGANWKAGANSVNNGNNTGWSFTPCNNIGNQFFMCFN